MHKMNIQLCSYCTPHYPGHREILLITVTFIELVYKIYSVFEHQCIPLNSIKKELYIFSSHNTNVLLMLCAIKLHPNYGEPAMVLKVCDTFKE